MYVTLEIIIASSTWNSEHCQSHPADVAAIEAVRAFVQQDAGNPVVQQDAGNPVDETMVAADSSHPDPMVVIVERAQPLAEIDEIHAVAAAESLRATWLNRSQAARQKAHDAKAIVFHMFHPKF